MPKSADLSYYLDVIILIHTSKTTRPKKITGRNPKSVPVLINEAMELAKYSKTLSIEQIIDVMKISKPLAEKVMLMHAEWSDDASSQIPAVDCFLGDIYSGLQANTWNESDRKYAQEHLRILSGLYGILRPEDGIRPYRLEMGYKLPDEPFVNLYKYWGNTIAETLPKNETIINLSAVEYSKTVAVYVDPEMILTPSFFTVNPKTGEPAFVVVHTKIARGAFASWMIRNRISEPQLLTGFAEIGYTYNPELSQQNIPAFVCQKFGGIGLSVRLNGRQVKN